jgi:hypothetical protein
MKEQTKNRLKAVYIIYVLAILFFWLVNFKKLTQDQERLLFVFLLVAHIPIYYAVYFWNKTPKK